MIRKLIVIAILAVVTGCFHTRWRIGTPLDKSAFEKTEISKTTIEDALDILGPPDFVAAETGSEDTSGNNEKTYMYWIYVDEVENRLFAPSGAGGARSRAMSFLSSRGRPSSSGVLLEAVWNECKFDRILLVFNQEGVLASRQLSRQTVD